MEEDHPDFDGPTIPANRRSRVPEAFLSLDDANDFARWSFFAGVFVGAVAVGIVLSILAVLT